MFESDSLKSDGSPIDLGVLLAEFAARGKDKLTLWSSQSLSSFGTWLEQLIAESTGKEGKGIIPVEGEEPLDIKRYGSDRFFVVLKLRGDQSTALSRTVRSLKKAGHAVIEMEWPSPAAIGAEFLRWEIITAVASVSMGIDPFDEPNVRESKDNTMRLLQEFQKTREFIAPSSLIQSSKVSSLSELRSKLPQGGYAALLVYTERSGQTQKAWNRLRGLLEEHLNVPVLLGFGPRYLHSIGQLYKGGTRKGVFLEFLIREGKDLAIPGAGYTFGQLKKAQALGDLEALQEKGLPVMAIELDPSWLRDLARLQKRLARSGKHD